VLIPHYRKRVTGLSQGGVAQAGGQGAQQVREGVAVVGGQSGQETLLVGDVQGHQSLSLLSLANPMVATVAGFIVLHQSLTVPQAAGFAVALGALVTGQMLVARKR
jgi:hypothetical protein